MAEPSWIAPAAFVLSVLSLVLTVRNQFKQDRRWKLTNAGRLALAKGELPVWKTVSLDEARQTNWGHNATFARDIADLEKCKMLYSIDARLDDGNAPVANWQPVFTRAEAEQQAASLKLVGNVLLCRRIRPTFTLRNQGKTLIQDASVVAWIQLPGIAYRECYRSKEPFTLDGEQESGFFFDAFLPLDDPMPPWIQFRFKLFSRDADYVGTEVEKEIYWDGETTSWHFGGCPQGATSDERDSKT